MPDGTSGRRNQRAARARGEDPGKLLPDVHLASYLNEFVFRFNRRRKRAGIRRAWSALQRTVDGELRKIRPC